MFLISMLRICFDLGILYTFVSMTNPRQDNHNPFCLMLQYTTLPLAARTFPDFVTLGSFNTHQSHPRIEIEKFLDLGGPNGSKPRTFLPLRPDVFEFVRNTTDVDSYLVMRDSTFKFFLNISILVFMYLGTLLTWAAVRKAHQTEEKVDMKKMRKIYSILLYFCICVAWFFCNTDHMKVGMSLESLKDQVFQKYWRDLMSNTYGSAFIVNVLAWSFLLVTIRVTYHCIQLIPPKTSSQCGYLQNYLAILNISVWYSFVALYFAYNFYRPSPQTTLTLPLTDIPFDENLLVSWLFLFAFIFAPPYRYRLPIPSFVLVRTGGGNLPEMQERFRNREKAAKKAAQKAQDYVELKMDGLIEPPPAYEAA